MRKVALMLYVFVPSILMAQSAQVDSMKQVLRGTENSELKVDVLNEIASLNLAHSTDSMAAYAQLALKLATEISYEHGIIESNKNLGVALYSKGMYSIGFRYFYDALRLSEQSNDTKELAKVLHNLGAAYFYQGNFRQALKHILHSSEVWQSINDSSGVATTQLAACECYQRLNQPDSAILNCQLALQVFENNGQQERVAHGYHYLAEAYMLKDDLDEAEKYFQRALRIVSQGKYWSVGVYLYKDYGNFYIVKSRFDLASLYFHKSLAALKVYNSRDALKETYKSLSAMHEQLNQYDSSLYYLKLYSSIIGPDINKERDDQLASLEAHYNLELQQKELQLTQNEVRWQRTVIVTVSIIALVIVTLSIVTMRLYLNLRKANKQLVELIDSVNEKNEEITAQASNLEQANAEIQHMNQNLEGLVNEKMKEIKVQNEKLIEYAYFNAHKVRGPVARLLGLVNIIQLDPTPFETENLLNMISESANELDEVVREINRKLDHPG